MSDKIYVPDNSMRALQGLIRPDSSFNLFSAGTLGATIEIDESGFDLLGYMPFRAYMEIVLGLLPPPFPYVRMTYARSYFGYGDGETPGASANIGDPYYPPITLNDWPYFGYITTFPFANDKAHVLTSLSKSVMSSRTYSENDGEYPHHVDPDLVLGEMPVAITEDYAYSLNCNFTGFGCIMEGTYDHAAESRAYLVLDTNVSYPYRAYWVAFHNFQNVEITCEDEYSSVIHPDIGQLYIVATVAGTAPPMVMTSKTMTGAYTQLGFSCSYLNGIRTLTSYKQLIIRGEKSMRTTQQTMRLLERKRFSSGPPPRPVSLLGREDDLYMVRHGDPDDPDETEYSYETPTGDAII